MSTSIAQLMCPKIIEPSSRVVLTLTFAHHKQSKAYELISVGRVVSTHQSPLSLDCFSRTLVTLSRSHRLLYYHIAQVKALPISVVHSVLARIETYAAERHEYAAEERRSSSPRSLLP